jgi:hypothetical protein
VAALHRAVALEQVHGVAVRVAEHLHFDVTRPRQVLLDQHAIVAEAARGLALARRERRREVLRALDHAHALAAAARARLEQHRVADPVGFAMQMGRRLVVAVIAGHERHRRRVHQRLRGRLRAHRGDRVDRRPDERDAGRVHACAKSSFSDRKP